MISSLAYRRLIAVLLVGLVLGCSDKGTGTGPTPPPSPPPPPPPPASSFSLTPKAASPNSRVTIVGLAQGLNLTGVYARVIAASSGSADTTFALVERDSLGAVFMVVPIHPAYASGSATGAVQVELTGPSAPTGQTGFTIQALPPASKTVVEQVDLLKAMATKWFEKQGTSRSELRQLDPNSVPIEKFPLWLAQYLLDDPANPNSLEQMVAGNAPDFPPDQMNRDLLAQIVSAADVQSLFTRQSAVLDGLPTLRATSPPAARMSLVMNRSFGRSCISAGGYGIDNGARLDEAMKLSRSAQAFTGGFTGRVYSDIGTAVGALGVIPALGGAATAAGGIMYVYDLLNQADGALLPSAFADGATTFKVLDKESYFEDDVQGRWEDFEVTATSTGWGLDELVVQLLAQISGIGDLGDIVSASAGLSGVEASLASFVIDQVVGEAIGAATDGQSFLQVCPGTWPGIPLRFDPWLTVEQPNGTSIGFTDNHFFKIKEPGTSEIRVATKAEFFGGTQAIRTKPVEVKAIVVNVTPNEARLDTATTATFTAEVVGANDERVRWIVPAGLEVVPAGDISNSSITIKTPDTPWDPSFTLLARSISEDGGRVGKSDSDPREGGTVIVVATGSIVITSPSRCLEPGETFQFTAQVYGLENTEVRWSRSAGGDSIDSVSGLYTAPQTTGSTSATIVAEVVGHPELHDEVSIGVGCTCNYGFRLGGTTIVAEPGDQVEFNSSDGRLAGVTAKRPSAAKWGVTLLPVDSQDQASWPNAPGSWPVRVQGGMGLTFPSDVLFSSDDNFAPLLNLEAYVPREQIRGSVSGTVKVISTPNRYLTFDWWFSIRYAPGQYGFCTVGGG